ncbi:HlyD family efflux transporter periplasmic adaptor subunit [Chroococcus sp. FPU101]|uniref:HlyD family efflux transporter periplasmic adaptor subunit n=1 Tax=Chroococcus sp. FPU101 TaxID=1974212 RepID=UPI001A8C9B64|nr:HlyD family efflux transporter periplasmic adaptor subunit [Chroococcus sp. FPU101]GFE70289.1 secretion protein HlyD family protein [Chroococcus sp. FPU101]
MSNQNGHRNGNDHLNANPSKNGAIITTNKEEKTQSLSAYSAFPDEEQSVILRQSPGWSRGVTLSIIGVTALGLLWAAFAPIEQVIPAKGELKPQGKVKEIQVPISGVVKEVFVKDGETVTKDSLLIKFDSTTSKAELESFRSIQTKIRQENQFYRALMNDEIKPSELASKLIELKVPRDVAILAKNRMELVAENQLYQVQVGETVNDLVLRPEEVSRLQAANNESKTRSSAARLDIDQVQKQLTQNQVLLAEAKSQLIVDRQVLAEIKDRNARTIEQSERSLEIEKNILKDIEPLGEEGAIAKYQINKQKQSVNDRQGEIIKQKADGLIEYNKQRQQIENRMAEIAKYQEEEKRLQYAISQAQEKYYNTNAQTEKDVRDKIADNQKRISEVDSQLSKNVFENEKKLAELESQISQAEQTLKYQELRAPVAGTVFDLQASPGFVPKSGQAEALLKIVPKDHLIAEVDITNADIGFVRVGQKVDIRIDSFPYSEYGDIKGKVISIGSDALPPDELHREYRFPAKVSLEQQSLRLKDANSGPLQSGMSVSANIKVNENRTVLSLFTELFRKKVDTLQEIR